MQVQNIIDLLLEKQILLSLNDGKLALEAANNAITPDIVALLKAHKADIVAYLQQRQQDSDADVAGFTLEKAQPDANNSYELSFAQQRLWFLDQLQGDSSNYNMPFALEIQGQFDLIVAEQTLNRIIERHQVLRSVYKSQQQGTATKGVQQLIGQWHCGIGQTDLSAFGNDQQQHKVNSALAKEAAKPFDLACDLMLRAHWLKLAENRGILMLTMHHIASDGWSVGVLMSEFSAIYQGLINNKPDVLPPLQWQYVDYAQSVRKQLSTEVLQAQLSYWQKQLDDAPLVHQLPLDFARPAQMAFKGALYHTSVDGKVLGALKQVALEYGVTEFMLLHSALSLLLSRYSNQSDILIGTPVANRRQQALEPMIGFFVNTLVLRTNTNGCERFADFLAQVKQVNLDAQLNQDIQFDQLVEQLKVPRSMQHTPLFQVMLSLDNNAKVPVALDGVTLTPLPLESALAKFDLLLDVSFDNDQIQLHWSYDTALFKPERIAIMAAHFANLLSAIATHHHGKLSELAMLSEQEQSYLLDELNDRSAQNAKVDGSMSGMLIHQVFEQQVARYGTKTAVVCDSDSLSYAALSQQSDQLGAYLQSQGVGVDSLVGLCLERSVHSIVAILAILKAGGAYVAMDSGYPQNRLDYIVGDSGVSLVLSDSATVEKFAGLAVNTLTIDTLDFTALNGSGPQKPAAQPGQGADSLAYVIYTSGSTGNPKGVLVEHRNVTRLFGSAAAEFDFNADDVWTLFHSVAFDFSVWEIWGPLLHGGRLVVVPYWQSRSPDEFYALLTEQKVTVLNQTPAAFNQLIAIDGTKPADVRLPLRYVIFGGEALNFAALRPWVDKYGDSQPELINMYGITETTVHVTYRRVYQDEIVAAKNLSLIGRPLADLTSVLLTPDGQLAPWGCEGELYIGGGGVARGYLNRDDLTAERFIDHPFVAGQRLYRTGDLARYHQGGDLEYLGRCDFQVKIRGFRIELSEIASSLLSLVQVKDAVVVARDEPKRLVAYVVPKQMPDEALLGEFVESLRAELSLQLPAHMLPSAFVLLEQMPLTANGKTDTKALPEPSAQKQSSAYVPPVSECEKRLAQVWQSQLGIEQIGIEDNFFTLGGDSIKAISVVAASKALGLDYGIKDIFSHQSIRALAVAIDSHNTQSEAIEALAPFALLTDSEREALENTGLRLDDAYPLSALQQGMVFHNLKAADSGAYHDVFSFKLASRFEQALFEQALNEVCLRHPALRSRFMVSGWAQQQRPLQLIYNQVTLALTVEDLRDFTPNSQQQYLTDWAEREKTLAFDFTNPLWQVIIHRLDDGTFYYHLSFHHALWDGWSVASFNTELFDRYHSLLNDKPVTVPAEPLSYAQFVATEQQALDNPADKAFWRTLLDGALMPWWAGSPSEQNRRLSYHINPANVSALSALAKQLGVQEKSVYLTIHLSLLWLLSGERDQVTSVVSNGRPEAQGAQQCLGLFLNSLPIRVNSFDANWHQLIRACEQQLVAIMAHRHYPLAAIQKATGLDFSASLFNYVDFHVYQQISDDIDVLAVEGFEKTNYSLQSNFAKDGQSGAMDVDIDFDASAFGADYLARVEHYLDNILTALLNQSASDIDSAMLIGAAEIERQLTRFNDTAVAFRDDISIDQLFVEQAAKRPGHIAIEYRHPEQGLVQLSYGELDKLTNRLAHYLQAKGVTRDVCVGICAERSIEMTVAIMAILKAGGAYVPLDPSYPLERLHFMVDDAKIRLVLGQTDLASLFFAKSVEFIDLDGLEDVLGEASDTLPAATHGPESLAYVIYTSGSTGNPKGVLIEHRALVNRIEWMNNEYGLSPNDKVLQKTPYSFDVSVWEFVWTLGFGATMVVAKPEGHKDPAYLKQLIADSGVTVLHFVPSMLNAYLAATRYDKETFARTVRYIFCSGEALAVESVKQLNKQAPHVALHNLYGPTEAAIDVSCFDTSELGARSVVPIGKPIQNIKLLVLDEQLKLCPLGVVGQLHIGGVGLARGYLNLPQMTAEKFIVDPFSDDTTARLYKTGDYARIGNDGNIEYIGRMDDQVKLRGLRIELGEIEYHLSQCAEVDSSVVMVREDVPSQARLVAYYRLQDGVQADSAALITRFKQQLQSHLPEHMVPAIYVEVTEWALSANGKINKKALPQPKLNALSEAYVAPSSDLEHQLAAIWAQLLDIDKAKISVNANFFELGGDSILSTQVVSRAAGQGIGLSVKQLFDHPTIARLALVAGQATAKVAPQQAISGQQPLLPLSHALFDDPIDCHYFNQSVLLKPQDDFDLQTLKAIVAQLFNRHDALRLTFAQHNGQWQGHYQPFSAQLLDMAVHSEIITGDISDIKELAQQYQQSFDLQNGPLFKAVLFAAKGQKRLLLVCHHLVIDGVSWRILLEDLHQLTAQKAAGLALALAAKTHSYQSWGEFLYEYAQSDVVEQTRQYWLKQGALEVAPLAEPVAEPSREQPTQVGVCRMNLNQAQTAQLLGQSHQAYRTKINELLLAALMLGLKRSFGQNRARISLETHGREAISEAFDLSQTVGWFSAMYPLTLSCEPDDLRALICGVKEQYRSVPGNGLSFGLLKYLAKDSEIAALDDSEILFNYLGQFDQVTNNDMAFAVVDEAKGQDVSDRRALGHGLIFNGMVTNGCVRFELVYDAKRYPQAKMAQLIEAMQTALLEISEHCLAQVDAYLTPSDFPQAQVSQAQLSQWQQQYAIDNLYMATGMQQGLLFHSALERSAYVVQTQVSIESGLNVEHFIAAWNSAIARHDIFRTVFVSDGDMPLQQLVLAEAQLPWQQIVLSDLASEQQQSYIEQFRDEDRAKGFDALSAPMMRITLFDLGNGAYEVLWSHHHALLDGWSAPLVFAEVAECYRALQTGSDANLAPIVPFSDYIGWLSTQDTDKARAFWQQQLSAIDGPTPLPQTAPICAQRTNEAVTTAQFGAVELQFTQAQTQQLSALAQQCQTTINVILQGAWAYLLSRTSAEPSVLFGTTVSGRPAQLPGVEQMVGLFINTIPAHIHIDNQATVAHWLNQLQQQLINRDEYSYMPLSDIHHCAIKAGFGSANTPLFESILIFENYPVDSALATQVDDAELNVTKVSGFEHTNYPLSLLASVSGTLEIKLEYLTERMDHDQVERIGAYLKTILLNMAQVPQQKVAQINGLSEPEQHHLIWGLNDNHCDYPRHWCMHQWFEQQVERSPEATALVFETQKISYRTLNRQANRLARYLRAKGVAVDVPVALYLEPGIDAIVAMLATHKAGGAYVPLDPSHPQSRLSYMVEDAQLSVMITTKALNAEQRPDVANVVVIDDIDLRDYRDDNLKLHSGQGPDNLAYILYTSGSTGRPKGVLIEQRNTLNLTKAMLDRVDYQGQDWLLLTTLSFDISLFEWFGALVTGGCCHIVTKTLQTDPFKLADYINHSGAGIVQTTPSRWQQLFDGGWQPSRPMILLCGGEPLSEEVKAGLLARGERVFNCYGPTEATVWSTMHQISAEQDRATSLAIGSGLNGYQHYVVRVMASGEQLLGEGDLVPFGAVGELYIGGDSVGRGYLRRDELTQKHFIDNPFATKPNQKLYRTGDLVRYLPNGLLAFVARVDAQVKIRGYRIELGEIENQLQQLQAVHACAVTVVEKNLVAYVTSNQSLERADTDSLRAELMAQLPEYMVPSVWVQLDSLPMTANGKVDKKALPQPNTEVLTKAFVAPTGEIEPALARLWSQLINVEQAQISTTANFFELGGHSLLLTRLVAQINRDFMIELSMHEVFACGSLKEMAALIGRHQDLGDGGISAIVSHNYPAGTPMPLSFSQQRLWFIDKFSGNSSQYNMTGGVRIKGALELSVAEQALGKIVSRHSVLRTVFAQTEDGPVQLVRDEVKLNTQVIELGERFADVQAVLDAEQQTPFDLANDLMLRALFVKEAPTQWVLVFTVHHIASDAWSMALMVDEFVSHYDAIVHQQDEQLAPPALQYGDYACWQRDTLLSDNGENRLLAKQLGYWQEQLAGLIPLHQLTPDFTRPARQSFNGARVDFAIEDGLYRSLEQLAKQHKVSLFMLLHGAFALLLSRHSQHSEVHDIAIGTPVAGRTQAQLHDLVGFFVNTLVLRSQIDNSEPLTFDAYLAQVKQTNIEAQSHQDIPFEYLVEKLNPERSTAHSPLFQIMFNLDIDAPAKDHHTGLEFTPLASDAVQAKVDLTLNARQNDNALRFDFEYNVDLFKASTIERMAEHFVNLLKAIVTRPDADIHQLNMLNDSETHALGVGLNQPLGQFDNGLLIDRWFEQQVAANPDKVALSFEQAQMSYGELNARANRLAHYLKAQGVGSEVLVGLCVERSFDMIVAILAVLKAGGGYVPLDPNYPTQRLAYQIEDSGIGLLLSQTQVWPRLGVECEELEVILLDDGACAEQLAQFTDTNPAQDDSRSASDLAYVIYTSGTTGNPKGVMVEHRQVQRLFSATDSLFGFNHNDVWTLFHSYAFDFSVWEIWGPLLYGGTLVIVPFWVARSPKDFYPLLHQQGVTVLNQTPTAFAHLDEIDATERASLSLRCVIFGGEVLNINSLKTWVERHGDDKVALVNMYGITETTVHVTYSRIKAADIAANQGSIIGLPMADLKVYVVRGEQLAPVGVEGEAWVGGAGVVRGYLNRPELSAERFIADPFSTDPRAKVYKTGDLVRYRDDGRLEYIGRIDQQVKVRGFRIELSEIEQQLLALPNVNSCAVVVRPSLGGDKQIVAYVVASQSEPYQGELRKALSLVLPEHMIPALFVTMDKLPLTSNGKVDKKALPAPDELSEQRPQYVAATTELELALAQIWCEVLGLEKVGIEDNFFELGGHSLLSARIQALVLAQLDIEVSLVDLFGHQTIRALAAFIDDNRQQMALIASIGTQADQDDAADDEEEEFLL